MPHCSRACGISQRRPSARPRTCCDQNCGRPRRSGGDAAHVARRRRTVVRIETVRHGPPNRHRRSPQPSLAASAASFGEAGSMPSARREPSAKRQHATASVREHGHRSRSDQNCRSPTVDAAHVHTQHRAAEAATPPCHRRSPRPSLTATSCGEQARQCAAPYRVSSQPLPRQFESTVSEAAAPYCVSSRAPSAKPQRSRLSPQGDRRIRYEPPAMLGRLRQQAPRSSGRPPQRRKSTGRAA